MSSERRVLYLVDGTSQMFRAYFAIRGLTNADGLATNAVFGFTSMLRKLLDDEKPGHIGVAFDLPGPTFREEKYADYKAQRPPVPEDLNAQFPFAKEVCEGFRIPVLELAGFEADDLIATYARLAREHGFDVVVVASDKDLLQLVGDGVVVLNPSKNLRLDPAGVKEAFGVFPEYVRDVLGLMGDAVDNIPGVPGVGEKTAIEMVSTYGGMDAILERAKRFVAAWSAKDAAVESGAPTRELSTAFDALLEIEPAGEFRDRIIAARAAIAVPAADPKQARALAKLLKDLDKGSSRRVWFAVAEHEEQARLSKDLATVHVDVPVTFDARALRLDPPDREKLTVLFRSLGFRTLTAEFEQAPAEEPAPTPAAERAAYHAVLTRAALSDLAKALRRAGRFAVDTETNHQDPMRAAIVGISVAWRAGEGFYIPLAHRYLGVPDQLDLEVVREILGPVLADPAIAKVGQNFKYDLHVLRRHGLPVEGWALDTMVAAFLLEPDRVSFGLDQLAAHLLGHETIKYASLVGTGAKQLTLDQVEVERVTDYAAEDAEVTFRLAEVLGPRLATAGVAELYRTMDGPLLPVLARMEATGIRIDAASLRAMSREMDVLLDRARKDIHELAGSPFNVDSPKQLREILYGKLGLTPGRKTAKSGVHSTDAQTLEDLAGEHEIARRLLAYRELAKLKGTYVDALPELVNPETGRIHTSYHPTGAATGRLSSSDPNLQNIPARSDVGLRIRSAFVPEPGWVFLASDYSQVELRVLAHLCEDPGLIEAFRAGEDIHRVTASKVFGVTPEAVDDGMRRRAKAVNFGILYGMSESRLARDQGMSRGEAREFMKAYFDRFRNVRAYIDRVREDATREGAVRTLFGRVRYFPALRRGGRAEVEQALRAAVNTTIQGTAADLMKLAMLRVDRALSDAGAKSRMLLQVHDELLLEVPEGEVEVVLPLVRRAMEEVHPLNVPLLAQTSVGRDWREVT
ncbi:MAG TPA: DNA polymerase I [Candidatus Polarisedimenticolaceae bacterium]